MLTIKTGLYALGALALAQDGLAAPAYGDGEGDVQYLPSRMKRDQSSAPLFSDKGPIFEDAAEGETSGTWFDSAVAAYAVGLKAEVKNHFALGDHKTTDKLSEVEVNFETINGRKTHKVTRGDTGAKDEDVWWAGAIRTAAANITDIGVDGLEGDCKIKEGQPDQALRLLTGRDATVTKEPSVDDQLKYAAEFAKSPVVFGFANNERDTTVAAWRAVVDYKKEDGMVPIVSFYQIGANKTPDLVLGEEGVFVVAVAHLNDILD
ncbi:hypothetical protein I317_00577 [Kwoniella heveanensis CBS 569]|nr:hypothetical protein I317_00577 [Kwoniella heveanensis CBS 569]